MERGANVGEIAEAMVNGSVCALCAVPFKHPTEKHAGTKDDPDAYFEHGHPAVCWDCWEDLREAEKAGYQRAIVPTY